MSILNAKRLRDYPRLMLFAVWSILAINVLLRQGWIGAFGQIIGGDFIMFYSTGLIYRSYPGMIYDYNTQTHVQQELVAPTNLPGYNPYMNPPFVAPLYSLLTITPINWAFIIWTLLAILSIFLSSYWLYRLFNINQRVPGFPLHQLIIIALSFFPFIEGLQSGQNHWLTLLIVTGIIYTIFTEKWYSAGALAGLLLYKPQFALGFIIIWLIWKNWKALISFSLVAAGWLGIFVSINGFGLFRTYLQMSKIFMDLPYIPGFPNYLMVTIYGFLTSIFPQSIQSILSTISQVLFVIYSIGLAWLAYKVRKVGMVERIPIIVAALIFPLLFTPYALLHDMIILVPAFVLWMIYSNSRPVLYISIIIYLGAFFLTFIAALTKIAWVSLLITGLLITIIVWFIKRLKLSSRTVSSI
jgi:Glycosyltransferase family 87